MVLTEKIKGYIELYHAMFSKRDEYVWIFGSWFGKKYDDNPRYFYEYVVKNHPEINAYWFTSSVTVFEHLRANKFPVILSDSNEAKRLALKAMYVFTCTGRIDVGEQNTKYLGGAYYINLWHGLPLKKIMYDNKFSKNSKIHDWIKKCIEYFPYRKYYVVSTSNTITDMYKSAFKVDKSHILQLGQPRNDVFYDGHHNRYRNLYKDKKIVLYMPTHRNEGKTIMQMNEILDMDNLGNLCEDENVIFLIKKHFYHTGEYDIQASNHSIVDLTNELTDSQELLDACDILITDYSSCYIDYLLLDRPIIFFNYDIENYLINDREMYFDYDDVTPGAKCCNYLELEDELRRLLNHKDSYIIERKRVRDIFYATETQCIVSENIFHEVSKLNNRKGK